MQKRVGCRLRKLKKSVAGLGGKGKLTDAFIDRLQNYYGIAIRSNVGNLEAMRRAVIAVLFHCASTEDNPMHGQCPPGDESWCKYQKHLALGSVDKFKAGPGLPRDVLNKVKPTYMELCSASLLEKCLHGKTQNANESFNGVLWQRVPKNNFVGLDTFRCGAWDAVVQFNEGFHGLLVVFKVLGVDPGVHTAAGYAVLDLDRKQDASRLSTPSAKLKRKLRRACRKKKNDKNEEAEGLVYQRGEF